MEKLSVHEIADAVCGKQNNSAYNSDIVQISTDTRTIVPGSLFVPIKGERFDGHDFIEKAFQLGAAAALSERPIPGVTGIILVEDTKKAYLDLAGWYRRRFPVSVIGITGSVGKTTTKEMTAAVLESRYQTLKTQGNHNNEIGLPATLFGLDSSFQMAVIEMGMSHFGEISRLSKCAAPNVGIITNIGVSHIENLGSREGILQAKLEILDGMERQAPLILNADDDLLAGMINELDRETIYYGIENEHAEIRAVSIDERGLETRFDVIYYGKKIEVKLPTVGRHHVSDALAAFSVGLVMDIAPEKMVRALAAYVPTGMRQKFVDRNGIRFIEDCYNASPDSMRAAIGVLSAIACDGRRIAVLGDMLELGQYSDEAHRLIGKLAAESKIDCLYCYGKQAEKIKESATQHGFQQTYWFTDKHDMAKEIQRTLKAGDCILFKGSRGTKLEEVLEEIYRES